MSIKENAVGGVSFDIANPINRLRVAAASSFFGEPKYYAGKPESNNGRFRHSGVHDYLFSVLRGDFEVNDSSSNMSPQQYMEFAIDKALAFSVEETLKLAVELRNTHYIRTTPQVILVRAANNPAAKGTQLIRQYAKDIIKRADEPSVQLAYQLGQYGKSVPNSLKRAWKDYLESVPEHVLAKYKMEGKDVKTIDVVRFCHASSDAIEKLVYNKLSLNESTWESYISANGSNKQTWEAAIPMMGHMALLRNLRNLNVAGVDDSLYLDELKGGVLKGKQLPFRYWAAYQNNTSNRTRTTLEQCMDIAVDNLPKLGGKVISLCDNSGSAHGTFQSSYGSVTVSQIANLTGVLTAKVADEGYVGVFGDRLDIQQISKTEGCLKQADKMNTIGRGIGQGTETGIWLFWDAAIKNKEHYDHVFVYSDMQAGYGQLYANTKVPKEYEFPGTGSHRGYSYISVPALIEKYRAEVNPNVMVYLVQVAGYNDALVPEAFDRTYVMGGWSDAVIKYAVQMDNLYNK